MILPAIMHRPVRLIEQLARPLHPLLAALFEDSGTGALVLDRNRRIVRTNRRLDAMLASCLAISEAGEGSVAAGQTVAASRLAPPPNGAAMAASRPAPDMPAETLFALADQQRVAAAFALALHDDPPSPLQVRLWSGNPASAPVVAMSMAPLRESDGEISGLLLRLTDVSAEKRLEAELAHVQKLQAVGQLAGGIAHDFNNLLTAIGVAADSVLEREKCEATTLDDVRQIRQSADRGAALVRQLLAFGRRQPLLPVVVAVNAAVRNLSDMLTRLLGEQIRLQLELEEPGRSVRVDPTQLDQVLINLAVNARDAMPGGGTLTLRTGHLTLYGPRQAGSETMLPGRYVAISVEDTGEGIPPSVLPKVFEPFFTTRRDSGGSGLGLSTVYGIVRQSGGFVTVESAVGQGTCARVWLPRHDETDVVSGVPKAGIPPAAITRAERPRAGIPTAGIPTAALHAAGTPPMANPAAGTPPMANPAAAIPPVANPAASIATPALPRAAIAPLAPPANAGLAPVPATQSSAPALRLLLVEDEETVRRLTERALQRAGWHVSAVDSAEAAMELLLRAGDPAGPPSVLVSDIVLPGMDGTELVRGVRAIWPDLPAVLVSGYTNSALLGDLTAQGVFFLAKPFRLRDLVVCVERAVACNRMV